MVHLNLWSAVSYGGPYSLMHGVKGQIVPSNRWATVSNHTYKAVPDKMSKVSAFTL